MFLSQNAYTDASLVNCLGGDIFKIMTFNNISVTLKKNS